MALLAAAAANKRVAVVDMDAQGMREAVSRYPHLVILIWSPLRRQGAAKRMMLRVS